MLTRKISELVLEKDQAQRVLHRLHVAIYLESTLLIDRPHAIDRLVVIAGPAQDLARPIGVKPRQRLAPLEIPDPAVRVRVPRNLPAAQMLAARREPERLGGV